MSSPPVRYQCLCLCSLRAAGLRAPIPSAALQRLRAPSCTLRTRSSAALPNATRGATPFRCKYKPTRRHNATVSTDLNMPSRGKRKPSAAVPSHIAEPPDPQQDIPPPEHYPPEVTSPGLRRSARQAAASSKTAAVDEDTGVGMKVSLREFEKMRAKGLSAERTAQKMDREVRSAWSGLAEARTGLEEMELSFKRDIKRRKLQVEESVVEIPATERSDGAFRPRPSSNAVDVLNTERILGFREDESGEDDGVEDGGQTADVEEGQQAQDEPAEAAGRAANRPPAVNSDNLPLPWKGRLGYVGFPFLCSRPGVLVLD